MQLHLWGLDLMPKQTSGLLSGPIRSFWTSPPQTQYFCTQGHCISQTLPRIREEHTLTESNLISIQTGPYRAHISGENRQILCVLTWEKQDFHVNFCFFYLRKCRCCRKLFLLGKCWQLHEETVGGTSGPLSPFPATPQNSKQRWSSRWGWSGIGWLSLLLKHFYVTYVQQYGSTGHQSQTDNLRKKCCFELDLFFMFGNFWQILNQNDNVRTETIILVLWCELVDARWSCGNLCEDFWFLGQKCLKFCQWSDSFPKSLYIIVRCPFREEHLAVCWKFFFYICHFGEDVPVTSHHITSYHVMSHPLSPCGGLLVAISAGLGQMVCSNGPPMYKSIWHLGQDVTSYHVMSPPISATAEGTDLI